MPTGISALSKTQIGVEATAGTGSVTTIWRGMGAIKDRRETVFPPERIGKIGGSSRSYVPRTGGEVLLEGVATFEQMNYIYNAGIYGIVTPTTDVGSSIIRQWTVQKDSTDPIATTDLFTMVVQDGDNIEVETANFCFVREYTLSGKQGEALKISATLQSRAPTTSGTFTAITDTDFENPAEAILMSNGALYIDPSTDTAGTTAKTETILEFTLKHKTGWVELPARDGRLDFSNIKHVDDEILLDITFEHNSVAIAEKNAWRNQSERVIRLEFAGSVLTTTDTYSTKLLRQDLYGKWLTFGAEGLEESDGDNIYRGTFKVAYCAVPAKKMIITDVCEVATLP